MSTSHQPVSILPSLSSRFSASSDLKHDLRLTSVCFGYITSTSSFQNAESPELIRPCCTTLLSPPRQDRSRSRSLTAILISCDSLLNLTFTLTRLSDCHNLPSAIARSLALSSHRLTNEKTLTICEGGHSPAAHRSQRRPSHTKAVPLSQASAPDNHKPNRHYARQ